MTQANYLSYKESERESINYLLIQKYHIHPCDFDQLLISLKEENPLMVAEMKNGQPVSVALVSDGRNIKITQLFKNLKKPIL